MNQLEIHKLIDKITASGPSSENLEIVTKTLNTNSDAKQYFFFKADVRWLSWLWTNDFLDVVKRKSDDPTRYSYSTPELGYLVRVATEDPKQVADIILKVKVSRDTFNPEVIDRFLGIGSSLPADQIARLVHKILDEEWIPLMGSFNRWGFEYEKMLKTLSEANDYSSIITLSKALLTTRSADEILKSSNGISFDSPFFFDELEHSKVFEYLSSVDPAHKEQALEVAINALKNVVLTAGSKGDDGTFGVPETFLLFDVNFFTLRLGQKDNISYRDDVRSLAAVVKSLTIDLFEEKSADQKRIRRIFEKYFAVLPDARSLWRLKLFIISQRSSIFRNELKDSFFRLFKTKHYGDIISGSEYEQSLRLGFSALTESEQREYIGKIFEYFGKLIEEKDDERLHKEYGWQIISSIKQGLTPQEKERCEKVFGKQWDPDFQLSPAVTSPRIGTIRPRGPITLEEFGKLAISDIAEKLRSEWVPENLRKQNSASDFRHPLNAEGLGELLRTDVSKRMQEYLNNAHLFFDRNSLDQHYTYSFLRGVEEILRENKISLDGIHWEGFIALALVITKSGEAEPFDHYVRGPEAHDGWLSGWTGVHSAMADALLKLLEEKGGRITIDLSKYRQDLISIVKYLLKYRDPVPADEEPATAKAKMKSPNSDEYLPTDPFTNAINTVRGRAFQVFVNFVYEDSKLLDPVKRLKIADDVKKVYEEVLAKEDTQALMFMFGRNLPQFYFRDKEWITGLLPQLFPTSKERQNLYLAAWEGYLSINLFEEIFSDENFQQLYHRAITIPPNEYPKRRYVRELDEGLGVHLALAFTHYEEFSFDSPLFQAFWKEKNSGRFGGFISLIGHLFVSGDNSQVDNVIKEKPSSLEKIKSFWDWALEHCEDVEALKEFAYWMNTEKKLFDLTWQAERIKNTLEKTGGAIDWDYGLSKSISEFAKAAPKETVQILRLHLLEGGLRLKNTRIPFSLDDEWLQAFTMVYANPETKTAAYDLINDLIREGGSTFWVLKNALND